MKKEITLQEFEENLKKLFKKYEKPLFSDEVYKDSKKHSELEDEFFNNSEAWQRMDAINKKFNYDTNSNVIMPLEYVEEIMHEIKKAEVFPTAIGGHFWGLSNKCPPKMKNLFMEGYILYKNYPNMKVCSPDYNRWSGVLNLFLYHYKPKYFNEMKEILLQEDKPRRGLLDVFRKKSNLDLNAIKFIEEKRKDKKWDSDLEDLLKTKTYQNKKIALLGE